MEDVDGALDAEVVQLAAHFEVQQVVLWTTRDARRTRRRRVESLLHTWWCCSKPCRDLKLTTVRYCSICPSTLPSLNWSLYCGRPMSSSQPLVSRGKKQGESRHDEVPRDAGANVGNLRVTQMKSSSADFSPCLLLTVLMASWSFFLCRGFFIPSSCGSVRRETLIIKCVQSR